MSSSGTPLSRKLRILVAEDEVLIGMAIQEELVDRGHEVVAASNGQAALELAAKLGPFDALVTDMHMPHLTGDELACRLRQQHPGLIVVVASANPSRQKLDILRALGGPMTVLSKPVPFGRVADAVERLAASGT